jgi:hypothetical protein
MCFTLVLDVVGRRKRWKMEAWLSCCGFCWICGDEDGGCVGGRDIDGKNG